MARQMSTRPEREILPGQKVSGELDGFPAGAQNCGTIRAAINMAMKRQSSRSANCAPIDNQESTHQQCGR